MTFEWWVNSSLPMTEKETAWARFAWEASALATQKKCAVEHAQTIYDLWKEMSEKLNTLP